MIEKIHYAPGDTILYGIAAVAGSGHYTYAPGRVPVACR